MEAITAERGQNVGVNEPDDEIIEVISEEVHQALNTKNSSETSNNSGGKKGNVIQRKYVLNDLGALKKKLGHEKRKHEFSFTKEAKDGSNAIIQMKASFFEYTKAKFIEEIQRCDEILSVENGEAAKASTDSSGDAYVEYSLDVRFNANNTDHTVKIIAYTTTCQLMIQPKGEQSGPKVHLGSKGTPRYFVETFLLPWCEKAMESKDFNDKISNFYVAALKDEIKRLETKKGAKNSNIAGELTDAKCVSKGCSFQGLNPNNKSAVGVCSKCGNFEHFACVKIRSEHKEDIIKGTMKYYCSTCFAKNPSIGTEVLPKSRPRINSIPVMGQGYLFKISQSTTATIVQSDKTKELTCILKCSSCSFETNSQGNLDEHIKGEHSFSCEHCDDKLPTSSALDEHLKAKHIIPCTKCDTLTILSQSELTIHMKACHEFPCDMCTTMFATVSELTEHKKIVHTNSCNHCNNTYTNLSDLEDHMDKCHKLPCTMCSETFTNVGQLLEHHKDNHEFKCDHCLVSYENKHELDKHVLETHLIHCIDCDSIFPANTDMDDHRACHHAKNTSSYVLKCSVCDAVFNDTQDLKEHNRLEHMVQCENCDEYFKSRTEMKVHMEKHIVKCDKCDTTTYTLQELDNHKKSTHNFSCPSCKSIFDSSTKVEEHKTEKHPNMCEICYDELENKDDLRKHIEDLHTYSCDCCGHLAISEDAIENHILEKHARPDSEGEYKCDECEYRTKEKSNFGKHYKEGHGSKSRNKVICIDSTKSKDEFEKLQEDNRLLRNNFERLEALYHDALEENNKIKSEYEAKLITCNDNYERAQSENEILKEKVDVLFKLGRSYLNNTKSEQEKAAIKNKEVTEASKHTEIEEVTIVDEKESENLDDLQAWSVSKMRGFKRVNPASNPKPNSPSKSGPSRIPNNNKQKETHDTPNYSASGAGSEVPKYVAGSSTHEQTGDGFSNGSQRERYCHYFVNEGKCHYEERTGLKCKFIHKVAPMCNFGMRCARKKCMYSHPKFAGTNNHFLGKNYPMTNSGMNIWQMMNPWLQNQYPPSPWIHQGNQRNR